MVIIAQEPIYYLWTCAIHSQFQLNAQTLPQAQIHTLNEDGALGLSQSQWKMVTTLASAAGRSTAVDQTQSLVDKKRNNIKLGIDIVWSKLLLLPGDRMMMIMLAIVPNRYGVDA